MELSKDAPKNLDLTFPVPVGGTHVWQIADEGIDKFVNPTTEKISLMIPLIVDSVIEGGDPENVGMKTTHFIPIQTQWGEKQLASLLSITGLMESFMKKYGENVDPMDEAFLAGLKLKLPGKFVQATHEVGENLKGNKQTNFTNFCELNSKKSTGSGRAAAKKAEATDAGEKDIPVSGW